MILLIFGGMRNRWSDDIRRAAQYRILMSYDPPRQLERLVAIVGFGCAERTIQDFARER